ncbi:unnamed protein product [Adineta steineri]|uniref:Uncharacterized protein n=1 Tax=Adineta steineri TaxID=433720 RepID=A0A819TS00_9BILA|nr:unnamed protein product [Adineta steineri]CAF4092034.1 unnamed protein product [Adineta steineri]
MRRIQSYESYQIVAIRKKPEESISHEITTLSTRQISVLDTIVGKSQALTSLQIRDINLILNGVTNIGTIAIDVSVRSQEVHHLVNCVGRLITSYVQEFLPHDTQLIQIMN